MDITNDGKISREEFTVTYVLRRPKIFWRPTEVMIDILDPGHEPRRLADGEVSQLFMF